MYCDVSIIRTGFKLCNYGMLGSLTNCFLAGQCCDLSEV